MIFVLFVLAYLGAVLLVAAARSFDEPSRQLEEHILRELDRDEARRRVKQDGWSCILSIVGDPMLVEGPDGWYAVPIIDPRQVDQNGDEIGCVWAQWKIL